MIYYIHIYYFLYLRLLLLDLAPPSVLEIYTLVSGTFPLFRVLL